MSQNETVLHFTQDARHSSELSANAIADYIRSAENAEAPLHTEAAQPQQQQQKPQQEFIHHQQKSAAPAAPAADDLEEVFEHAKHDESPLASYPISQGLTTAESEQRLLKHGRNELPEKVTPKWRIFLSLLYQPMPCMIWTAAIVEAALGDYTDVGMLCGINMINASISFYETVKAGDAIAALKSAVKPTCVCFRDGKWDQRFDSRLLVPGDLVELCAGSAVPADCMINSGQIEVDESAMTGESLPVTLSERDMAKMGGNVVRGETHGTVVFTGKDTFFGKTASMLTKGESHSNLQKLLLKIVIILCVLSFVLCGTAFVYLLSQHQGLKKSASFAVVVLVASIPMAIEIVTTSTLAIGSKMMSKYGAIVSRLAAIEDLAGLNLLCSDKTGTLTKNKMMIQSDAPAFEPNVDRNELLKQAALATRWDSPPKDALDTLVLRCPLWYPELQSALDAYAAQHPEVSAEERQRWSSDQIAMRMREALSQYQLLSFLPFDPRHKRTESTVKCLRTGEIRKVTKGAPHVIVKLDRDASKGSRMMQKVTELSQDGVRAMAIAISEPLNDQWPTTNTTNNNNNNSTSSSHAANNNNSNQEEPENLKVEWHISGLLTFLDPPRDDTKETIMKAQQYGVSVRMVTGDHLLIARKTCRDLEMGDRSRPHWPNINGPDHLPTLTEDGEPPADLVQKNGCQ